MYVSHGWASVRTSSTLGRYSSAIRAACAKERSCGSARGAISDGRPHRDRQITLGTAIRYKRDFELLLVRDIPWVLKAWSAVPSTEYIPSLRLGKENSPLASVVVDATRVPSPTKISCKHAHPRRGNPTVSVIHEAANGWGASLVCILALNRRDQQSNGHNENWLHARIVNAVNERYGDVSPITPSLRSV